MDVSIWGIVGVAAMMIMVATGFHIAVALGLMGIVGLAVLGGFNAAVYTSASLSFLTISQYTLVIVPLFVLMGMLAQAGGQSGDIYNSLRLWVGGMKGGLGIATVAGCTLFGTVCGSAMVTATVFAQVSAPEMRRQGYEKKFAYAIPSAAGMIGMLIPPSVLIVIYANLSQQSVGALLIDGTVPGLMLFAIFSAGIFLMVSFRPSLAPSAKINVTWRQRLASLKSLWGIILAVVVVFGGILGGVFSSSEVGAIATSLLLLLFLTSKRRSWEGLKSSLLSTASTTAMVFLILITAAIFSRFLVLSTITPRFMELVVNANFSPVVFLVAASLVYMLLGCFLDSISMLSLTLPFLHPAAVALGINPLQFAMVAILAVHIGLITPPVGLNVFAVKGVAEPDVSLEDLYAGVFPFFLMSLVCLALFIFLPVLSTFLPSLMIK